MPPKKDPLVLIGTSVFKEKKDPVTVHSEVVDLERGFEAGFIYEVPKNIRQGNEKAYTPQSISIGPLHYSKKKLAKMTKYKVSYQNKFLQRTSKETLESFLSFVEQKEKEIVNYYEASSTIDDKFVWIIFFDAIFIVELFLRNYEKEKEKKLEIKDFLLNATWSAGLRRDLILLENQIPMFVLQKLYELYRNFRREDKSNSASTLPFLHHACIYFDIPWDEKFKDMETPHFTGLQRCHLIKKCPLNPDPSQIPPLKTVYNATILHAAGVELTAEPDQNACLLDIKLDGKLLIIPKLTVHSNTEAYMRNVMAFEMCRYPVEAYVCAYIQLLNYLIKSNKDVELLIEKGILSKEGKNEGNLVSRINPNIMVAGMFKKLMQGVGEPPACYRETGNQLNQLYIDARKHKKTIYLKKNLAILKSVYFANLWRGTGTVAAFMVVVLTLIQTVLGFLK